MKQAKWWQPFLVASLIGAASVNPTAPGADEASALALDPTLTWTNFLGSAKNDDGYGVAVDAAGNLYLVGTSFATWGNPLRAHSGGPDLVVAKLDGSGKVMWNTFLGSMEPIAKLPVAIEPQVGEGQKRLLLPLSVFARSSSTLAAWRYPVFQP